MKSVTKFLYVKTSSGKVVAFPDVSGKRNPSTHMLMRLFSLKMPRPSTKADFDVFSVYNTILYFQNRLVLSK